MRTIINNNNYYKLILIDIKMKTKIILITSIMLFILVLIGIYSMIIINQFNQFAWVEPFAPLIILTGFFVFMLSAGLFIYSIIRLVKE